MKRSLASLLILAALTCAAPAFAQSAPQLPAAATKPTVSTDASAPPALDELEKAWLDAFDVRKEYARLLVKRTERLALLSDMLEKLVSELRDAANELGQLQADVASAQLTTEEAEVKKKIEARHPGYSWDPKTRQFTKLPEPPKDEKKKGGGDLPDFPPLNFAIGFGALLPLLAKGATRVNPWLMGAGIAADALGATAGSMSARKNQKKQIEAEKELANQRVALEESGRDPFRQQVQQGKAIAGLDMLERASYAPTQVNLPAGNRYAGNVPQFSGGFNYTKSPELTSGAGRLKQDVMAGHTAPSMTNPANYGRTAALDLTAPPLGPSINDLTEDEEFAPSYRRKMRRSSLGLA